MRPKSNSPQTLREDGQGYPPGPSSNNGKGSNETPSPNDAYNIKTLPLKLNNQMSQILR